MAVITNFPFISRVRSDASHHLLRYSGGKLRQSGRGLAFWFSPDNSSIAEVPVDDRDMSFFVNGRSGDFQTISVQGAIGWRVTEPERVAERVDFTIDRAKGIALRQPIERIESRLTSLVTQAALQYLSEADVRTLLETGLEPLRVRLTTALSDDPTLTGIGVAVVSVRVNAISPSAELERALQTPTFEALQQKADQATFERRAMAVEKERAIAENELANQVELAKRTKQLIAEQSANARSEAEGNAQTTQIEADAQASKIAALAKANNEAESDRVAIYKNLAPGVIYGLAARTFAEKLKGIEHLNITPDLLASLTQSLRPPGGK
jgi:regulator of protease activity HflC (stomatin/prohibitin superfamily)